MRKRLRVLLVVVIVAAVGFFAWRRFGASEEARPGNVVLYGNVELRDAALAFEGEEQVAEVLVEEGDPVVPGQPMARLETDQLQAQLDGVEARIAAQEAVVARLEAGSRPQEIAQARAEVAAAEARVANCERALARLKETSGSGATSAQALDDGQAALDVERAALQVRQQALELAVEGPRREDVDEARAALRALQADRELLQVRLADSTLLAPSAGHVQSRLLEVGELASPQRPAFTLALSDPKWVRAYVPEPKLSRVKNGARATVRGDGLPERSYEGWVGFLSPVAEFTPKSVETSDLRTKLVYEVRVYVHDPGDDLRLGMPVTVEIDNDGGAQAPRGAARDEADSR